VYLPDARITYDGAYSSKAMADELFAALDARMQQARDACTGRRPTLIIAATWRRRMNRGANRDQKGVTLRTDTGVTGVTALGGPGLISTAFHILLY
jgi:hypothetical protein